MKSLLRVVLYVAVITAMVLSFLPTKAASGSSKAMVAGILNLPCPGPVQLPKPN